MDAARTASAPPAVSPSYRWSSPPTPPDAITGIPPRSTMARVSRMSYPSRVPSRSMLVSRISPAPHSSIRADQSTASISVGVRPPWVTTSPSPGRRVGPRGRVDRHLVGSRGKQVADVVERPDAAADRQWHEHLFGGAAHHVDEDVALLVGCGDVEKGDLVGLLLVVPAGDFHRVARIP